MSLYQDHEGSHREPAATESAGTYTSEDKRRDEARAERVRAFERREAHAFRARIAVTEVAMDLARAGLSDEVIREMMKDVAAGAAERAIAWGAEEDRRQALADRIDDIQDEMDARRPAALAEQEGA